MRRASLEGPTSPSRSERLPWGSLSVLSLATFSVVTAEMLPTAVLEPMSRGLGTSPARAAQLVSIWAGIVVVSGFPLVRLTRGLDRRDVITAGLGVVAASAALTALAPTYSTAVAARVLGAAAVGLLWATVNARVADMVPDRRLGAAVSVVLGGATAGMVIGTPLARRLADLTGWRTSFVALAGLALLAAALVRLYVPRDRAAPGDGVGVVTAGRATVRPMMGVAGLVAVVLIGHYGAYTFITILTGPWAAVLPGGVSTLLLGFGVASALGIAIAGRVRERTLPALGTAVVLTALALGALPGLLRSPVLGVAAVLLWGVASGAVPALAQTEIMRRAGERHRSTAGALIPVLFNGGIAVGAALASLLAARAGAAAVPLPAAAVVLAAGLALLVLRRG